MQRSKVDQGQAQTREAVQKGTLLSPSPNGFGNWLDTRVQVLAGRYRLSPREQEILLLLVHGVCQKEIGGKVGCAYSSVRTHISRMSAKLGCSGTTELVLRFFSELAEASSQRSV